MTATPTSSAPQPDVYLHFLAEINPSTAEALVAQMAQYATSGVKHVYLLLSTPGGSVMHGMTIYNALRAMPFDLTVHNVGNVDSIGNVVFLAGARRFACEHSTFMFHGVGFDSGNVRLEQKQLREFLDSIEADQRRMGSILVANTHLTEAEVGDLFLEAKTKDSAYAVSRGIVHEVRDAALVPGVPVHSLVFQR